MIQIPNPCNEDWTKMQIVRDGRYCLNCQKNVVDFTKMERHEIIQYLLLNRNKSICGNIKSSMIDFDLTDLYATVQRVSKIKRNSNLAFCILSAGALFLASCESSPPIAPKQESTTGVIMVSPSENDSLNSPINKVKVETSENSPSKPQVIFREENLRGDICVISPTIEQGPFPEPIPEPIPAPGLVENEIYAMPEIFAEYTGGTSAMIKFLSNNIQIPSEFDGSGKIYVRLVVNEDGSVGNVKILKNSTGEISLDKEAIRLVQSMPNWIPAQMNGKNVKSYFNLPIKIEGIK